MLDSHVGGCSHCQPFRVVRQVVIAVGHLKEQQALREKAATLARRRRMRNELWLAEAPRGFAERYCGIAAECKPVTIERLVDERHVKRVGPRPKLQKFGERLYAREVQGSPHRASFCCSEDSS